MISPLLLAAALLVGPAASDPAFPAMDSCFIVTSATSVGAGFMTDGGLVVTAAHVVEGAVDVQLESGEKTSRRASGTVIYRDDEADVAVIRPSTDLGLTALHVTPTPPSKGDTVYAVGSPIEGLVASRGLVLSADTSVIESTAPVDHGNSGGPLLSEAGDVVGVVVQMNELTGNSLAVSGAVVEQAVQAAEESPTADAASSDPAAATPASRSTSLAGWVALLVPLTFAFAVAALLISLLALRHARGRARNRIVITLDEE